MRSINLFYLLIVLSCVFGGCTAEGLTGPEGPVGQSGAKGETGAVGPAGKDGSIMYSGTGAPNIAIGVAGDYYLDRATGSLYGPKIAAGWGTPLTLVGAQGVAGANGATGATGAAGSNGATGATGANGSNGTNGSNGATGATGVTGANGSTGATGANGSNGTNGSNGANGTDGTRTLSGTTAPGLTTGNIGDYYLDKTSYLLYGPKNISGWGVPLLLRGAAGPQGPAGLPGADGTVIYGGDYNPDPALGKVGDFYFGRLVATMFGPKTSAGWGSGTLLRGPAGDDGADGANGADGSKILTGLGAPDLDTGIAGDFYLDKQTFRLYGPKNVDGWGSGTSLKGSDGNANITALETGDGLSFSWAYENSIRVLRKQVGVGNDTATVFNIPAAHVAAVKNGIVMVYIGKDEGAGSYSWKQLNYTDYSMGVNAHYKYALRVNPADAKIRIFHDAQVDYTPLQVDKVRIVITPASSTEVLNTTKNGSSPMLKTMKRFNLRDSDFKKF